MPSSAKPTGIQTGPGKLSPDSLSGSSLKKAYTSIPGFHTHPPPGSDSALEVTDSTNSEGDSLLYSRSDHVHAHGVRGGGSTHATSTSSAAGYVPSASGQSVGYVYRVDAGGTPDWEPPPLFLYGDGSDGDLNVTSSDTTLTGGEQYDTITFGSSHTGFIFTANNALRCLVLDLTNAQAGAINTDGATGADGGGSPPAPTEENTDQELPFGQAGAPSNTAVSSVTWSLGGNGGASGGAGTSAGSANDKKAGGVSTLKIRGPYPGPLHCGLGGGGGDAPDADQTGGQGGNGAGYLRIYAQRIITDGTTIAGAISARGGNGGDGVTDASPTLGGGGGGGGGGGSIEGVTESKTGTVVTDLLDASGGDGGTGGDSTGAGNEGAGGGDGGGGGAIFVLIKGGAVLYVKGSAGAAGTQIADSGGLSGGAGGAGGSCVGDL